MIEARCHDCGGTMLVDDPVIELVNQLSFSAIVLNHGMMDGKTCPKCGKQYFIAIQEYNMAALKFILVPVPPPEPEQSIIMAPGGFDPKKVF